MATVWLLPLVSLDELRDAIFTGHGDMASLSKCAAREEKTYLCGDLGFAKMEDAETARLGQRAFSRMSSQ